MTATLAREITDVGPELLGSPALSATDAYRIQLDHPYVTDEESDALGRQIYDGRLATHWLEDDTLEISPADRAHFQQAVELGGQARRVMASRHLQLVVGLARKFSYENWRYDDQKMEDMVGVGNLALMQCMEGYIYQPGRHFTPFAQRSVLNAMLYEVGRNIRMNTGLSHKMQRQLRQVNTAYQAAVEAGEDVTYLDVAERLGFTEDRIDKLLQLKATATERLDEVIDEEEDGRKLLDKVEDTDATHQLDETEDKLALEQIWAAARELRRKKLITEEEWFVFVGRYSIGMSQQELATTLGYAGQSGAANIEQQVTKKVRQEVENPGSVGKKAPAEFRIVETCTDLLEVLGIETGEDVDITATAQYILERTKLTTIQRITMEALLGIDNEGEPRRPHQVAKWRGVTYHAVYVAREAAMKRIVDGWQKATAAQAQAV